MKPHEQRNAERGSSTRKLSILLGLTSLLLVSLVAWLSVPYAGETLRAWWTSAPELAGRWPNRGLNNTGELWKNGYLGLFFRHELFGALPWLGLPAMLAFFITARGRQRWQLALFFSGVLSAILITIKGFNNWRYAFTLQPLLVAFILFVAWTVSDRRIIRAGLILLICLMVFQSMRCQSGRYRWFMKSLNSKQEDGLPRAFIDHLNAEDSREPCAVLAFGCKWAGYYLNRNVINYTHPSINRLLRRPSKRALNLLHDEHGIGYVVSSDLDEARLVNTSMRKFIRLLHERGMGLSDRGRFLYNIEPGTVSWSEICGTLEETALPVVKSSEPVPLDLLNEEILWLATDWRGRVTVQNPGASSETLRLLAEEGEQESRSSRAASGLEGLARPAGANIVEFECELKSDGSSPIGALSLNLDARIEPGWLRGVAAKQVFPSGKWRTYRTILFLDNKYESVNPVLEWRPGAEGAAIEIRAPRLLWIPFPAGEQPGSRLAKTQLSNGKGTKGRE